MRISDDIYLVGSGRLGFDWTHEADCNLYLIGTGSGGVLIDSGTGLATEQIVRHIGACGFEPGDITHILLTHLHADHSGGAAELRRRTGAEVCVLDAAAPALAAADEEAIDLPQARAAGFYPPDYRWQPCIPDILLSDGARLHIGECTFTALHTPGHSGYDMCFYMEREGRPPVLISGDTVMYGGKISMLGTSDFRLDKLKASIGRLALLSPELLLPGHGQPALARAAWHVRKADDIFGRLGIPDNIG
ncbi:Metallo-beta-lactamase L1 precursor [compost metagenome]